MSVSCQSFPVISSILKINFHGTRYSHNPIVLLVDYLREKPLGIRYNRFTVGDQSDPEWLIILYLLFRPALLILILLCV